MHLRAGEGTAERCNLLSVGGGLIRYMCSRNARPKKWSLVRETEAMCRWVCLDSHCGVSGLLVLSLVVIRDVAEMLTTMVEVPV